MPHLFQIDHNASFDWNGDSSSDLIVTNGESINISVLLGNGNGSSVFPVGTDPSSLAVGDFNADGKLDLVIVEKRPGGTANSMALFGRRHLGMFTSVSVSFDAIISYL